LLKPVLALVTTVAAETYAGSTRREVAHDSPVV
jgi:hypothetical protein